MTNSRNSKRRKGDPPRAGYDDKRYKATRQTLRRIGPHICGWCGYPIDLQLPYPHPLSWSVDHVIPRSRLHPDDPRQWHISNAQECHRRCNSARGDKPLPNAPSQQIDTSIDW